MAETISLYVDDSGVRLPDRKAGGSRRDRDWFGLGGILVDDGDKEAVKEKHRQLVRDWPEIDGVWLHSVDIRSRSKKFKWLGLDAARHTKFLDDLTAILCSSPIICIAAVIDRPGYMARYESMYDPAQRWQLCKTALCILIERSVKFAMERGKKLRVFVEATNKVTDAAMKAYVDDLCKNGPPFNPSNMGTYRPLTAADLRSTIFEFRARGKDSRLMQLADLCLYPMCIHPYAANRSYDALREAGKLIDCVLPPDQIPTRGIKYYRFELWHEQRAAMGQLA